MDEAVRRLIEQGGRTVTYTRITKGAFNATTLKPAVGTTTNYTVKMSVVKFSPREMANNPFLEQGDRKGLLPALGLAFQPDDGDKVTVNGKVYNVRSVVDIAAKNEITHYQLYLRGHDG